MKIELSLLDTMAVWMGCTYVSDLHALSPWQRSQLAGKVKYIRLEAATLAEWNDALVYLVHDPPQKTAKEAKTRLIRELSQPTVLVKKRRKEVK